MLKTLAIMAAASAVTAQPMEAPLVLTPLKLLPRPMVVEIAKDPITDAVSAFAIARAPDGRLSIGCDPDRYRGVQVSFRSESWLAEEKVLTKNRVMHYRFDDAVPVRGRWNIDDDTASLRPKSHIPAFLSWVAHSRQLTIRSKDIENRERDLVFSLADGGPAIDKMLQACAAVDVRRAMDGF